MLLDARRDNDDNAAKDNTAADFKLATDGKDHGL